MKGGWGGWGNLCFVIFRNFVFDFSEKGELGEELDVFLELKLLVDVGLVGFFSVGKLILLFIVLKVKFKIGVYYFIMIKLNLGVVLMFD